MKIYIAAPFPAWRYAQLVARFLIQCGHEITSKWHDIEAQNGGSSDDVGCAKRDIAEIDAADALVLLNGPLGQGGRHFETGYAMAAKKYVCVFGERENIFHVLMPIFHKADDLAAGLEAATREPSLKDLWKEQAEWSQATFGADSVRGPIGPLKHLASEVGEAISMPNDITEYADMMMLLFDAARRAGFTLDELKKAFAAKLKVNKARKWGKPNAQGFTEHVRDASTTAT